MRIWTLIGSCKLRRFLERMTRETCFVWRSVRVWLAGQLVCRFGIGLCDCCYMCVRKRVLAVKKEAEEVSYISTIGVFRNLSQKTCVLENDFASFIR